MSEYPRRSTRAITSVPTYNNYQQPQRVGTQQYNSVQPVEQVAPPPPQITEPDMKPPLPASDVSATTKALSDQETPKWRKPNVRLPAAIRKKRLNARLSKLVPPKSAISVLHELKPGVTYNTIQTGMAFKAEAKHEGITLATGVGSSKAAAKDSAAESAIKKVIADIAENNRTAKALAANTANVTADGDTPMEEDTNSANDTAGNLPWAGLASYAMYKLLQEWHSEGIELSLSEFICQPPPPSVPFTVRPGKPVEALPENPTSKHPTSLLIQMRPGLPMQEISRTPPPNSSVTVGFEIDGQMYTGVGSNRKKARKEAAKHALQALFGVVYPPEPPTAAANGATL